MKLSKNKFPDRAASKKIGCYISQGHGGVTVHIDEQSSADGYIELTPKQARLFALEMLRQSNEAKGYFGDE
jgi:hypothetical protein